MENFNKRNADFLNVVNKIQRDGVAGRPATVNYAIRTAINTEAPSFYLTREHVWKRLHERRRRLPPREKPHRRRMWEEIETALRNRLAHHPSEEPWVALDHVLANHRPSGFFITEEYARKLVYRLMRGKA